jgi:hypothetical protein
LELAGVFSRDLGPCTAVDGLAEAAIPRTSHHPSKAKGAAKALLYAAFGAAAWNAQSALLQSRLAFAGAPAVGAGSSGISDVARLEVHMQATLLNTSFNDT